MSPDAPDPGDPGAPSDAPSDGFDPLVEQAEAIRARGQARAASLDASSSPTPVPPARRPIGLLLALLVALLAGAVIGWVARGEDPGDQAADPTVTTLASSTTVPSSTSVRSSTTLEAAPAVPVPATAPTSTPPTTPPTVAPPDQGGAPASPPAMAHTVAVGESFWAIAEQEVGQLTGGAPTEAQVATYWRVLVDSNAGNLVQPGNPNLILPGQVLDLPPVVVP